MAPARLHLALVLEPAVTRARRAEMQALAMVAFGDAAGALTRPEPGITWSWPDLIRLDGARVERAALALDPDDTDPPRWMALALSPEIGRAGRPDPGRDPARTCLAEKGCAGLTARALTGAVARHLEARLHEWQTDGREGIHSAWIARLDPAAPLAPGLAGRPAGFDADGNTVLADADRTGISLLQALGRRADVPA